MKKRDLKKLALLGLTGGIMLGSQSVVANEAESSGTLIAHSGCGANSCNNQPSGPKAGRNSRTSNGCAAPSQRTTNGCAAPNQKTTNSCNAQNREASNSCGSPSGPNNSCNSYFRNARNGGEIAQADEKVSNPGKLTESDLLDQLNDQAKQQYLGMSPEGKALALKLANQNCKGQNDCKGLNSCKSAENSCAGKGACKGKSQCAFKDKNLAVKVAAKKMADKRSGLSQ